MCVLDRHEVHKILILVTYKTLLPQLMLAFYSTLLGGGGEEQSLFIAGCGGGGLGLVVAMLEFTQYPHNALWFYDAHTPHW